MWMKIDDGLHAHRKTRAVTKGADGKTRDAAPMGLWILAGSWAAQNNRDGWVPKDELDRWDDDWEALAKRLVHAGYWWPEQREGEAGYGFNDWQEWNNPDGASASGTFGNHVRWHVNKGVVKTDCEHCPEPPSVVEGNEDEPDEEPESSGRYRGDDRGDIARSIGANRLPVPDPTRPEPVPTRGSDVPSIASPPRDDVERICNHLADAIEANGSRRPAVTARWRKEARLLIDKDKRTEDDVHRAIDWCQRDAFWKANVMSVQKLRQQYDRLRLDAQRQNGLGQGGKQQATEDMFSRAASRMGVAPTLGAIE